MKKSVLKQLLKIKKRMHIMSLKNVQIATDRKSATLEINGIEVKFSNLDSADFLSFWHDSPSASAKLLGEIKRAYDEAEDDLPKE
jgi:hypothetical protein